LNEEYGDDAVDRLGRRHGHKVEVISKLGIFGNRGLSQTNIGFVSYSLLALSNSKYQKATT